MKKGKAVEETKYSVRRSESKSHYLLMEGEKIMKMFMNPTRAYAELDKLEKLAKTFVVKKEDQ